jgi:hypothetical protein
MKVRYWRIDVAQHERKGQQPLAFDAFEFGWYEVIAPSD